MEEIRLIETKLNTRENSRKKVSRKSKAIYYSNLKKIIISINACITLTLIILLSVGYTDMLNISSNNLLIDSSNSDLQTELSSIKEIVENSNSNKKIEKIAMSRLGMIYPTEKNFIKLDKEINETQVGFNSDENENNKSIISEITDLFR
ncbi:hypothetical protein [Helcococcus sueciensis]|uniref:hypothetical protein n=1 Tax=Helcococcus sueciensis TaxID=241555 RepID=UPI0003F6CB78|nr:hypothetical protein [Helcococcus sueciensis]